MIYQYVVTLKREHEKYIDAFNIFLCLFSIFAFGFEQTRNKPVNYYFVAGIVAISAGVLMKWYTRWKTHQLVRYSYVMLVAGVLWIFMPYLQWFAAVFFVLAFLEYQAKYPLEIGFTDNEVVINSLLKRKFPWTDFNNVILKDGLLTLDFKNNRLFQKETLDENDEDDADEEEFNAYCRKRLESA